MFIKRIFKKKDDKKNNKNEQALKACVGIVMLETGKSQIDVEQEIKDTRKLFKFKYHEYTRYKLYKYPIEQREEKYIEGKTNREKRIEAKKEKYLDRVVKDSGWTREYALSQMEKSVQATGASYEHYAIYGFWKLSEEEQKKYFVKGDAVAIRRRFNIDQEIIYQLKNKDFCNEIFAEYMRRNWIKTNEIDKASFIQKFGECGKIIYKPKGGTGGHGIIVYSFDKENIDSVIEEIRNLDEGIVEEYLIQHEEMQKFSLNALNTIRIVTVFTKEDIPGVKRNKVNFVYAAMRMGCGDSYVDNLHSGGLMAVIDLETGEIITAGANHLCEAYEKHPDTNNVIRGFKIPYFEEAKKMIEKAGQGKYGFFGWDVAITQNGPALIEVNTSPGADGLQSPFVPEGKGVKYMIKKYLPEN